MEGRPVRPPRYRISLFPRGKNGRGRSETRVGRSEMDTPAN